MSARQLLPLVPSGSFRPAAAPSRGLGRRSLKDQYNQSPQGHLELDIPARLERMPNLRRSARIRTHYVQPHRGANEDAAHPGILGPVTTLMCGSTTFWLCDTRSSKANLNKQRGEIVILRCLPGGACLNLGQTQNATTRTNQGRSSNRHIAITAGSNSSMSAASAAEEMLCAYAGHAARNAVNHDFTSDNLAPTQIGLRTGLMKTDSQGLTPVVLGEVTVQLNHHCVCDAAPDDDRQILYRVPGREDFLRDIATRWSTEIPRWCQIKHKIYPRRYAQARCLAMLIKHPETFFQIQIWAHSQRDGLGLGKNNGHPTGI
ncbi:hypothetical protein FB451DRAFT_1183409 [Mycena latifolia]|nr:hypothetical protein FB451DRAFT_1183409 [Mycena latifolia]